MLNVNRAPDLSLLLYFEMLFESELNRNLENSSDYDEDDSNCGDRIESMMPNDDDMMDITQTRDSRLVRAPLDIIQVYWSQVRPALVRGFLTQTVNDDIGNEDDITAAPDFNNYDNDII